MNKALTAVFAVSLLLSAAITIPATYYTLRVRQEILDAGYITEKVAHPAGTDLWFNGDVFIPQYRSASWEVRVSDGRRTVQMWVNEAEFNAIQVGDKWQP